MGQARISACLIVNRIAGKAHYRLPGCLVERRGSPGAFPDEVGAVSHDAEPQAFPIGDTGPMPCPSSSTAKKSRPPECRNTIVIRLARACLIALSPLPERYGRGGSASATSGTSTRPVHTNGQGRPWTDSLHGKFPKCFHESFRGFPERVDPRAILRVSSIAPRTRLKIRAAAAASGAWRSASRS